LDYSPRFRSDQFCAIPFALGKITEQLMQKFLGSLITVRTPLF